MLERHNLRRQAASRREGSAGGGSEPRPTSGTTRSLSGGSSEAADALEAPEALDALLRDTDALDSFLDTLPVDPTVPGQGTDSAFAAALLGYALPPAQAAPPAWQVEDLARLQAAVDAMANDSEHDVSSTKPFHQIRHHVQVLLLRDSAYIEQH
jgi:hypothetical protein